MTNKDINSESWKFRPSCVPQQLALEQALMADFGDSLPVLPDHAWSHYGLTVLLDRRLALDVFRQLREGKRFFFNMLVDITCVDWLDKKEYRFEVVYHLFSLTFFHRLCLKIQVPESDAEVASVRSLWPAANFLEREVWDMFGIKFKGHGDLRRILMYDEFDGHPLRKDYPLRKKQARVPLRVAELRNTSNDLCRPELAGSAIVMSQLKPDGGWDEQWPQALSPTEYQGLPRKEVGNDWKSSELPDNLHSKTMIINLGPSHPATHGTVRLLIEVNGERIERADVDVGYLHRGFEKQCEHCTYNQVIPYADRLNYVSPLINNVGWVIAVEHLFGIEAPLRAQFIRVMLSEISRITDHLTCLGAASMELGAFTVMLYLMQAREELYELLEMVTGARITVSYTRVGGLKEDLPQGLLEEIPKRFAKIKKHLADADRLLTRNRIFQDRLSGVGVIAPDEAIAYGLTGPILRASGVNYDVRKVFPYSGYENFDFEVPLGSKGDNLDRFIVRFNEIEQSMRIVEQAAAQLPGGPVNVDDPRVILPDKAQVYNSIEGMISQFEIVFGGIKPPAGEIYFPVEGGNGELGFYVVSDGSGRPYRVRVRPPCFLAMGIFGPLIEGYTIADVVPCFGLINMIGGECDR